MIHEKFLNLKKNPNLLVVNNSENKKVLERLLKDEYVRKKCNRSRRIPEQLRYIETYCPELIREVKNPGIVLDIGPGPGEFLEICRFLGHDTKGYDAPLNDSEMGDNYVMFSHLSSKNQKLDIEYIGFENIIESLPQKDNSVFFINSRGSIEQVFKAHLRGVPHRIHKQSSYLCWDIDQTLRDKFIKFFKEISRVLQPGGVFFIHGNGTMNTSEYDKLIVETVREISSLFLDIDYSPRSNRTHKIRKK
tara:strand:+ start:409 stop:1152 length:744 start_codon:yes stop_codon:yes gene_type:complete